MPGMARPARLEVFTVRRLGWLYWVAPLMALGTTGCQDSETGRSTAAEIGPDGGILRLNNATLRIPEGALAYSVRVELVDLGRKSVVPPITTQLAGPAFALRPHGTHFDKPASLTLPYQAESTDYVYAARLENEQDRTWTFIAGSGQFADERKATIEIDGFSVYAVVKTGRAVDFGSGGNGGTGGSTTGNGGGAGELGEYEYDRFCELICAARADLECRSDRSQEICTSQCIADPPNQAGDCYPEFIALNKCVWEIIPTAFECGSDGRSAVKNEVCVDEQADIVDCQGL